MSENDAADPREAEVVGVPPETPEPVRPSATGVVAGPLDEEPDVELADPRQGQPGSPA